MFKKRLGTALWLILILIAVIYFSYQVPILFFAVGNIIIFLGVREFTRMTGGVLSLGVLGGMALFSAVFIQAAGPEFLPRHLHFFADPQWVNAVLFLAVIALFIFQATRRDSSAAIVRISSTIAAIIYVAWLFSFLPRINYYFHNGGGGGDGRYYIFFLFLVVKVNDSAAYFVGSWMGKHKLIPRISPGKTVEGAVGGVLFAGLSAVGARFVFNLVRISWPAALTLGFVLGAAAVMGDLAESILKRSAARKDSGRTLPGLGGILDLFDSLFFTAPLLYLYMKLILKL